MMGISPPIIPVSSTEIVSVTAFLNEWGMPPVELHPMLYQYAKRLADKGKYVPALAVASGFTFEDQIFKGLEMGSPFVKLFGMARSPIAAAMVDKSDVDAMLDV